MFKLSERSINNLVDVDHCLQTIVHHAITITVIDFGVTEGLRSVETQRKYFESGASQTMNSKHLTGDAVDLIAYVEGRYTWKSVWYDEMADAMCTAAREHGKGLRWGGAWHIPDITKYCGTMEEATQEYITLRVSQGRKPFLDYPHYENIS